MHINNPLKTFVISEYADRLNYKKKTNKFGTKYALLFQYMANHVFSPLFIYVRYIARIFIQKYFKLLDKNRSFIGDEKNLINPNRSALNWQSELLSSIKFPNHAVQIQG